MKRLVLILAVLIFAAQVPIAQATVTFGYEREFSGAFPPASDPTVNPWLTATFATVAAGVELTLEATNLTGSEFVTGWYFNLDPTLSATSLSFAPVVGNTVGSTGTILTGVDAFKADGDGLYDIQITFPTNNSGGGVQRFKAGETITYLITGISGLTEEMFNYLSAPDGGSGPFPTAAHVQGIADDKSGWVTVPEPGTLLLLGSGLIGVAVIRRRFNK